MLSIRRMSTNRDHFRDAKALDDDQCNVVIVSHVFDRVRNWYRDGGGDQRG